MDGFSDLSEKIKNKKYNNKEFRLLWSNGSLTAEINFCQLIAWRMKTCILASVRSNIPKELLN